VLAAPLSACGGAAAESSSSDSTPAAGGLLGKPAPDFSVGAVANGKGKVALSDLRGKVVLVDFRGTFCEPCKKSFPKLQDLHTKYATSGLKIVGISEDEGDGKGSIPGFARASSVTRTSATTTGKRSRSRRRSRSSSDEGSLGGA